MKFIENRSPGSVLITASLVENGSDVYSTTGRLCLDRLHGLRLLTGLTRDWAMGTKVYETPRQCIIADHSNDPAVSRSDAVPLGRWGDHNNASTVGRFAQSRRQHRPPARRRVPRRGQRPGS